MGSVSYNGPYIGWNGSANVGDCWHKSPTMFGSGTISAWRNSDNPSRITVHIVGNCVRPGGTYGFPVYIDVYANGQVLHPKAEIQNHSFEMPIGGNWNLDETFSFETNDAVTFGVHYICGQTGGCTRGYGDVDMGGRLYESEYVPPPPTPPEPPYIPPTPPTWGAVFSNTTPEGSTGGNIKCKPDGSVWFNWSGETQGSESIDSYAIDYSTTNNVNNRGTFIYPYNKGTQVSLTGLWNSLGKDKFRPGTTLYFWVNMHTSQSGWAFTPKYLGSITMVKDGVAYYYDSSGVKHEIVNSYYYDSNGGKHANRYMYYYDSGGAKHVLDIYTELY